MKKWLGIFIRNEYLCSQVNAGVHRTYSMFVMILEKSPKQEGRVRITKVLDKVNEGIR